MGAAWRCQQEIAELQAFLRIAPSDPRADEVRSRLAQAQAESQQ